MKVNGFVMAHDQDIWIGQVIRNVMEVVDELIVLHHTSSDNTRDEIEKAISGYSHARICEFKELRKGHTHVAPYAGKDCWAWQIDGDE
jgi:hypothetical protein